MSDRPQALPSPVVTALADAAGLALLAWAAWVTAFSLAVPVWPYDEGIVLAHAQALSRGGLPHRDFFWLVPLCVRLPLAWRLFGAQALIVAEKPAPGP